MRRNGVSGNIERRAGRWKQNRAITGGNKAKKRGENLSLGLDCRVGFSVCLDYRVEFSVCSDCLIKFFSLGFVLWGANGISGKTEGRAGQWKRKPAKLSDNRWERGWEKRRKPGGLFGLSGWISRLFGLSGRIFCLLELSGWFFVLEFCNTGAVHGVTGSTEG